MILTLTLTLIKYSGGEIVDLVNLGGGEIVNMVPCGTTKVKEVLSRLHKI